MIGQTLGKYRIQDRIGRGGMGTVYLAVDDTLHREVAIKVLNPELNDPEIARRFRAEAITVARLSHPGIATVYELFEKDEQWLMVMEFVRGETLEHLIERSGPLPVDRAVDLITQALTALAHAHSMGVVHRDLKPANLMVTEAGTVKIMDFGIARVAGTEHLTTAGFMMGTPAYMAPEQVLGHEIDARADLYAMGVVLYRLTTGKLPFKGDTPFAMAQSQVNDPPTPVGLMRQGLPGWVEQVIGRALSKSPADRFQTADQFREALKNGLAGLPIPAAPNAFVPPELLMTTPPGQMAAPTVASRGAGARSAGKTATGKAAVASSTSAAGFTAAMPVWIQQNLIPVSIGVGVLVIVLVAGGFWLSSRSAAPVDPNAASATIAAADPNAATNPPPAPLSDPTAAGAIQGAQDAQATSDAGSTSGQPPPTGDDAAGAADTSGTSSAVPPPVAPPPATATGSRATPPASSTPPPGAPGTKTNPPARSTAPPPPPSTSGAAAPVSSTSTPPASTTSSNPPPAASGPPPAGASRGRGTVVPEVMDPLVAYSDVKILTVTGDKSDDQNVVINFVGGTITIVSDKGGAPLYSLPYKYLVHATYVKNKEPKWDPALPAPSQKFDLPGLFKPSRHWLVLQSKTGYVILRLEDQNFDQIITTVEKRTGVKVDRSESDGQ